MVVKSNSRSNKWYVTTKSASTKSENFIHFASIHRYVGIRTYSSEHSKHKKKRQQRHKTRVLVFKQMNYNYFTALI